MLRLGADEYVDYTEQDVGEVVSDADAAFDTVGGQTTESLLPAVRVEIAEAIPLAEVQRAHVSESGHTRGKLVLTV